VRDNAERFLQGIAGVTTPKLRWGDARVAFRIIAPRVQEALRSGRSVRSVYEEMKPHFPGGYVQFAKYARESGARTKGREPAVSGARATAAPEPVNGREAAGPRELVLWQPARFKHDPNPDSSDLI
jgi:hypothetical protein